jgi:hypothetical protein
MSGYKVERIVRATVLKPNFYRAIGGLDIEGNETNHPLTNVGHFSLLDDATISSAKTPPFGRHPHAGATITSILFRGGSVDSWDSAAQKVGSVAPGQLATLHSANGMIVHDERTASAERTELAQCAFFANYDPLPESCVVVRDSPLPAEGNWRVVIDNEKPRVSLIHALVRGELELNLPQLDCGFVWSRADAQDLHVAGVQLEALAVAVLNRGENGTLKITGNGEVLVGVSEAVDPFHKLLFANGFVLAATPEETYRYKEIFEANFKKFVEQTFQN